ncbi:FecR family protein [Sinomicrobium weinanense]|uniref:DUF4974 domain-containing protein n=1 Tax=Sinomicrobium weinanense TaxID=2842200 RepID=A0A926JRZ6_9FLAO|nr:FecR domain-containing protein [Sinomicrobium weinanense]MBC9796425.1 DUF4974 domain-containing protein [Sinomicrobium weinanense]MBU3125901.1 DUF4974 domain-containing protein [Sinomicrobium weinanense]
MKKLSYAAVLIMFLGLGYFFYQKQAIDQNKTRVVVDNKAITLEKANGIVRVLSDSLEGFITDEDGNVIGKQNGKELVYNTAILPGATGYNILKIPYGKQFSVQLSDGTKVRLNAGSRLKYPVPFAKGKERRIFLEGEAYFDVAHDAEHPFVVTLNNLNVKVLGTAFNVSDYREDRVSEVVLVRGSVRLQFVDDSVARNKEMMLTPGDQAIYSKSGHTVKTKKVNTDLYTSWINGLMVFRDIPFEIMLKKLERHYNVVFRNNNQKLANEKFSATIDLENDDINTVLEYFNKIYGIDYIIRNNEIIIN